MKKSLRKSLIYLIMTMLVLPTWLVTGMMNVQHAKAATNVTTVAANNITSTDATLNGVNGVTNATGHSFWVSLAPFDTSSSTIPAGVYSTPDLGSITANTPFLASLSSITTTGIPANLPIIAPNTKYYFVAWSYVGAWNPGEILNFTTGPVLTLDAPSTATITKSTSLISSTSSGKADNNDDVNAIVTAGLSPIPVTLTNTGTVASNNVRIIPIGAGLHIQFWAMDSADNWYDINIAGWMPTAGISFPAGYTGTTDIYAISDVAGLYSLTVNLVDAVTPSTIIASTTGTITVVLPGTISAEDFGVVNYDTGIATGQLKGYTAGFGLADADFTGASSVVMQLFATDDQLLQTNTLIGAVSGTQISSPFDVSGTFNYIADGYWTNVRASEYGQSVPATKVVATVTLANGKVVTAENTSLTGDPTTIYPPAITVPASPVITSKVIEGRKIELNWSSVEGAKFYYVYVSSSAISEGQYIRKDKITAPVTHDEITVGAYGKYYVVVTAEDNYGNVSAIPIASNQTIVNVTAPVTTTAPVPAPAPVTTSIAPQAAQAAEPTTTTPAVTNSNTNADDQGQIKGDETTNTTEKTNWTPWIVLFVLIILAGAATGGYFYWFAGEDEVQAVVKEPKKEEKSEKFETSVKTKQTNNKPNKKAKRW